MDCSQLGPPARCLQGCPHFCRALCHTGKGRWTITINTKKNMKSISHVLSIVTLGCTLSLSAETTQTEKTTDVTKNADGSVSKTETTTTTFNPDSRTKVVKYFETYKTNPNGLPPSWVAKVKVKEIPAAWRTTRIAPGGSLTPR